MLNPTPRVESTGVQGEREFVFRSLFDSEEGRLLRYAFALVGRRAVAEEIVQEAFLQLHRQWDEVEVPKAWLFRSVRNRAYNHLRDHQRERLDGQDCLEPDDERSPEQVLQRQEISQAVRQLVVELEEPDRQLVKLKYFEGLKYRDISDRTGLSVSNVGYRLHHALKDLAGKLQPLGIDEIS